MPKAMEKKLKAIAKKKGFGKGRTGAFVYGTMRKTGWTPSTQKKGKKKKGKVRHMRLGGIVRKRTRAILGEAGPEAVIPLKGGFKTRKRVKRLALGKLGPTGSQGLGAEINMREQRRISAAQNVRGPALGGLFGRRGGGRMGLGALGGGLRSRLRSRFSRGR